MLTPNIGQIMAEAWKKIGEETPDIFDSRNHTYGPGWTYREMLDFQPVNAYGRKIPRIVTIRRNLRILKVGNTSVWRGPIVRDRRQQKGRRRADSHD